MNSPYHVNASIAVAFNSSVCNGTHWNETRRHICANLSLTSLNNTGVADKGGHSGGNREAKESVIIRFFLIALIFVLIVIGNSLTIHVVRSNRNLTSIKNYYYGYYIMNLSISDLLVGLVCLPTTFLYYLFPKPWIFGLFLCKLFPTLQTIVVSASISTLTVITFERFLAIVHPLKPRSTAASVRIKIIAIWIWSFIIALPSFIAYKIDEQQSCREFGIAHWYTIVLFLVNYAVPLTFIFCAYLRITLELKSQSNAGSAKEFSVHKKFLKLTVILVVSFALCLLPTNVIFFLLDYSSTEFDPATISVVLQYFHILIWFNSCLNPFIYGSVDTYFKRGFKKALGLVSSNESQERTNVSRMSTFRMEKPALESYTRLSAATPMQNNLRDGSNTGEIFEGGRMLGSQNNNKSKRTNAIASSSSTSERRRARSQMQNSTADKTEYISLVLYQSNGESNMNSTNGTYDESKEVFVDLDPRKRIDTEAGGTQDMQLDMLNKEEFNMKIKLSKETAL